MSHRQKKGKQENLSDWDNEDQSLSKSEDGELKDQIYYGEDHEEHHDYYIGIGSWDSSRTEEETISDSNYRVLNCLESGSVISILEDLIQEIIILKYVIAAPVVSEWSFGYKTLKERFSGSQSKEKIFPEVDSTPVLTTPLKLLRDRQFIENVIRDTIKTLMDDGTFEPVFEAAYIVHQEHNDEENLVKEFETNLYYMRDLKRSVEEKRKLDDFEEKQRDELLYKLQDEVDDVILKCSMDEKFVDKWERTRDKQNKWRLQNSEDFYRKKISDLNTKSAIEERVNREMQLFIKRNQMELEEQLEEWMTKYDAEMDRRENKILQLKYMRDQTEDEVKRLEQLVQMYLRISERGTEKIPKNAVQMSARLGPEPNFFSFLPRYESRKIEMKEWIRYRDLMKRRSAASLIIQSWWRGFMVRRKLGPYKEKKAKPEKP